MTFLLEGGMEMGVLNGMRKKHCCKQQKYVKKSLKLLFQARKKGNQMTLISLDFVYKDDLCIFKFQTQ